MTPLGISQIKNQRFYLWKNQRIFFIKLIFVIFYFNYMLSFNGAHRFLEWGAEAAIGGPSLREVGLWVYSIFLACFFKRQGIQTQSFQSPKQHTFVVILLTPSLMAFHRYISFQPKLVRFITWVPSLGVLIMVSRTMRIEERESRGTAFGQESRDWKSMVGSMDPG